MMKAKKAISLRRQRWGYVILMTSVVYATLYIARPICNFLRSNVPFFDRTASIALVIAAAAALGAIHYLKKKGLITKDSTFYLLAGAVVIYALISWQVKLAEEKLHFLEYAILSLLIYRALSLDVRGWRLYLFSFILVFILGWMDELIQYILPNRYYEFRDVAMNGIGGIIGLVFVFIVNMDRAKAPALKFTAKRKI